MSIRSLNVQVEKIHNLNNTNARMVAELDRRRGVSR